jgi:hypothetical protein
VQGGTDNWRQVAKAADASLLGRLDQAWRMARAEAEDGRLRPSGRGSGAAGRSQRRPAGPHPARPGTYRCRTIKLGRRAEGQGLAYVEYPWFACSVELTPAAIWS